MHVSEPKKTEVRAVLTGEMEKRYATVKKRLGMENDADILRLLITQEYERITASRT